MSSNFGHFLPHFIINTVPHSFYRLPVSSRAHCNDVSSQYMPFSSHPLSTHAWVFLIWITIWSFSNHHFFFLDLRRIFFFFVFCLGLHWINCFQKYGTFCDIGSSTHRYERCSHLGRSPPIFMFCSFYCRDLHILVRFIRWYLKIV